jgi:hypothetical protein
MTVVGIHQPNFFPWLGFFYKMNESDIFIILDDADSPISGSSWTNRVKLKSEGIPAWYTAPIKHSGIASRTISDMEFAESLWRPKLEKRLIKNYAHADHSSAHLDWLLAMLNQETEVVANYNLSNIREISNEVLSAPPKIVLASSLGVTSVGTQRLIDLTLSVGGDCYISGLGSSGYLEIDKFKNYDLTLAYSSFDETNLRELTIDFTPGLSIIDTILNTGLENTKNFLSINHGRVH